MLVPNVPRWKIGVEMESAKSSGAESLAIHRIQKLNCCRTTWTRALENKLLAQRNWPDNASKCNCSCREIGQKAHRKLIAHAKNWLESVPKFEFTRLDISYEVHIKPAAWAESLAVHFLKIWEISSQIGQWAPREALPEFGQNHARVQKPDIRYQKRNARGGYSSK